MTSRAQGQPKVTLILESESTFRIVAADARLTFHREDLGKVERVTLFQGGQEMPGRRLEPFAPSVEDLAQYVGDYYSPELGTSYSIAVKDDGLVALHRRHGEIELTPTVKFSGAAWHFGPVWFERDDAGGVDACSERPTPRRAAVGGRAAPHRIHLRRSRDSLRSNRVSVDLPCCSRPGWRLETSGAPAHDSYGGAPGLSAEPRGQLGGEVRRSARGGARGMTRLRLRKAQAPRRVPAGSARTPLPR